MPSQDIQIDVGMDPSAYLAGVQQISASNATLSQSFRTTVPTAVMLQRAMDVVTPKRASLLAWGAMAASAANTEQQLSGLAATATVTHVNTQRLAGGMRQLARDFPIGNDGARQLVQQFTEMGVASAGSEKRILDLSKAAIKLAGATGEAPAALAQGMSDLARATGNTNLDPKRFEALGDSLTTVSKTTGAGAGNILAFSKAIAPMANAAGIGATGVLGISSAFAKMGDDGVTATTAVSKMLSDINRSVRDGSPMLTTYAQMTGKTAQAFTQMFKTNPSQTILDITNAIGKAGPTGGRLLDEIGIDGVRGQRAFQNLAASGQLASSINTAVGAYGSGSTDKAQEAAYNGLNDSLVELKSSSQQLADAFGAPLLGPLTAFAKALKMPVNALTNVIGSGPVQSGLKLGAEGLMAIMAARAIIGPLTALGFGKQAATSGPVRSFFSGMAAGRGQTNAAGEGEGFSSRFGRYMTVARGTIDPNEEGKLSKGQERMWQLGHGMGARLGPGGPAAYTFAQRMRMGLGAVATAAQLNMNMMTGSLYNAGQPNPNLRVPVGFNGGPAFAGFGTELANAWKMRNVPANGWAPIKLGNGAILNPLAPQYTPSGHAIHPSLLAQQSRVHLGIGQPLTLPNNPLAGTLGPQGAGGIAGAQNALRSFSDRLLKAGEGANVFTRSALALARVGLSGTATGMGMVGGTLKAGGKLIQNVTNGLGGPVAIGVTGAILAGQAMAGNEQATKDAQDAYGNSSLTQTLDMYRESIGKATDTMTTVNSLSDGLGKSLAKAAVTFDDATKVTTADDAAATGAAKHIFVGSKKQVASEIANIAPGGMNPDDLQAIKLDVRRQFSHSDTQDIMNMLPSSVFGSPSGTVSAKGYDSTSIHDAIGAAANAPGKGGMAGVWNFVTTAGNHGSTHHNWLGDALGPGGKAYASALSDDATSQLQDMTHGIGDTFARQQNQYKGGYAAQERDKAMNEAAAAASKTGNADIIQKVTSDFVKQLTGKNDIRISQEDIQKYGGFTGALAHYDKKFAGDESALADEKKKAGGEIKPEMQSGFISTLLTNISPTFSKLFDAKNFGPAAQAVQASMNAPGDVGTLDKAADATVDAAKKTGQSMADLGTAASAAANNLDEASQEFKIVKAAQAKAELQMRKDALNQTGTQAEMTQYAYQERLANQQAKNPTQMAEKEQATQYIVGADEAHKARLVQRLEMQRQYETQVTRMTQDEGKQELYAQQDYDTQVTRAKDQAQTARLRMIKDYNRQVQRADEDYTTQRQRAQRDFNISMTRADEDNHKQRLRAYRDFSIQQQRMVEDAAANMYDVYDRIQSKPTWDAKNLLGNMSEQTDAIVKQKAQLDQLRKAGLSQQAINQLKLGDVANAQQVNQLAGDITTDPHLAAQLNAEAKRREAAAKSMVNDPSNVANQRGKEDFARQMKDGATDFAINQKRARADFSKSMADMAYDFHKAMKRGAEDLATNLNRATEDLSRALDYMQSDYNRGLDRMRDALKTQLGHMAEDIKNADTTINGTIAQLAEAVDASIHGKAKSYQKLIVSDTQDFVKSLKDLGPTMQAALDPYGITLPLNPKGFGGGSGSPSGKGNVSARNNAMYGAGGPAQDSPSGGASHGYEMPVHGSFPMTSPFGYRTDPITGARKFHSGEDFGTPIGTAVYAALAGIVKWAGNRNDGYGNYVILDHGAGKESIYGHLSALGVKPGQHVDTSNVIGRSGNSGRSTGPHLHFETRVNGTAVDPHLAAGWSDSSSGGEIDLNAVFAKVFDTKRGGIYGRIRDNVEAALTDKLSSLNINGPGDSLSGTYKGDMGAHSGNARANQAIARGLLSKYGISPSEMGALIELWNGESGWNQFADNPSSDAYGIPQALPGSKMASVGNDWRTNPSTQIKWGLQYIHDRYGTPSEAWRQWNERSPHWYAAGGVFGAGPQVIGVGEKGPEAVIPLNDAGVAVLARAFSQYMSMEDRRGIDAANCSHMTVVHNERITYDNRNDFADAKITVVSNDPDDMGRKLERRQTQQRLTQTRGVRWGR